MITITVHGSPAPQGSKTRGRNGGLFESSKKVAPWREAVRGETQRAMIGADMAAIDGPVLLDITFYLPRPKSIPKGQFYPVKYPDLDKLQRSTFDGLSEGGALANDSRVVDVHARKLYATPEHPAGATIKLVTL